MARCVYRRQSGANAAPNTNNWRIRFQLDSGGTPSTIVSSTLIADADVGHQTLGTGVLNGQTVTVYELTAVLPDFLATAGVKYWFTPLSIATAFSPTFLWIEGTGGNGLSAQTHSTNGAVDGTSSNEADLTFTLSVPEPMTLALLGTGLLRLGAARRRRRSAA